MKKLTKLTVLLLALVMVLSLCACGGDDAGKALVGSWGLEYDLADALANELGSDYADFDASLKMTLMFDFNADGTFKMYVEEESFTKNFDAWLDELVDYSADMLYDILEGQGMSREEADDFILQTFGMNMDEYTQALRAELASELDANELMGEVETSGTYKTKGDKLYMAEGSDKIDESYYDIFTVSGNKLTLDLPEGVDESEGEIVPGMSYPLVFEKK